MSDKIMDMFDDILKRLDKLEKNRSNLTFGDLAKWGGVLTLQDIKFDKINERLDKLDASFEEMARQIDTMSQVMHGTPPKPRYHRGQEVEVSTGLCWVAGLYVDAKEDTKYAHGVYVFVTRMVEWWPDENIRPKQESK